MKHALWQLLLGSWLLVLAGCAEATFPPATVPELCPSAGAYSNWVLLQPETLEFVDGSGVDIGTITDFRFIVVLSDGRPPTEAGACAGAVVYPEAENLPVFSEVTRRERLGDISEQASGIEVAALLDRPLYVYFAGIDAGRSAGEVNEAVDGAVHAIRQAIAQNSDSPNNATLAQNVTQYLLTNHGEFVQEDDIIDYGAFVLQPSQWPINRLHGGYGEWGQLYFRYEMLFYQSPPQPEAQAIPATSNVIKNGGFERPWRTYEGAEQFWYPYSNGPATGWSSELWEEAVFRGERSQLLGVGLLAPGQTNRIVGLYQTVEVVPNSTYDLSFFALMRTDAPKELRSRDEYQLAWGIDFSGQGNYENVSSWVPALLTEQPRIGSNIDRFGEPYRPLFFEQVRGRVVTRQSDRISLFFRGLKRNATGHEVNFNFDEVSLVGPSPGYVPPPSPAEAVVEVAPETPQSVVTPRLAVPVTPTPAPLSTVPTDSENQFLTFLQNKYSTINDQPIEIEAIYLSDATSTFRGQTVHLDLTDSGLTVFIAQVREIQDDYAKNLLEDTITHFEGESSNAYLSGLSSVSFDERNSSCYTINTTRACAIKGSYTVEGNDFVQATFRNGAENIEILVPAASP